MTLWRGRFAFRETLAEARACAVGRFVKFAMRNCHVNSPRLTIDANTVKICGQLNDRTVAGQC
jgi:hypothetical protein